MYLTNSVINYDNHMIRLSVNSHVVCLRENGDGKPEVELSSGFGSTFMTIPNTISHKAKSL